VIVLWLVYRENHIGTALATVVILFALMIAVVWTMVALSRRGLIVQTPLRRNLVLGLVIWMIISAVISWPVDVGKGWMGVAALVALFAIVVWPPRRESSQE
jgi:Sec-independent protein secretion pathway component TatC